MGLARALPKKLQASLCEVDHLAFVVVVKLIVRLDWTVGNRLDLVDNVLGLADQLDEALILRLEELQQRPYRNVLEGRIAAPQEPNQVPVNSTVGRLPILYKNRVIAN